MKKYRKMHKVLQSNGYKIWSRYQDERKRGWRIKITVVKQVEHWYDWENRTMQEEDDNICKFIVQRHFPKATVHNAGSLGITLTWIKPYPNNETRNYWERWKQGNERRP